MESSRAYHMTEGMHLMSEETRDPGSEDQEAQTKKTRREALAGGLNKGLGMLNAMKDSIEESIREAKESGNLSPERARELINQGIRKAQGAAEGARGVFDFVSQKEFDELRLRVVELRDRVLRVEEEVGVQGSNDSAENGPQGEG